MSREAASIVPIGDVVSDLLKNKFSECSYVKIFSSWEGVVGGNIAKISTPHKVMSFGGKKILVLKAKKGYAIQLQHESYKILRMIHKSCGSVLFSQIKIIQMDA